MNCYTFHCHLSVLLNFFSWWKVFILKKCKSSSNFLLNGGWYNILKHFFFLFQLYIFHSSLTTRVKLLLCKLKQSAFRNFGVLNSPRYQNLFSHNWQLCKRTPLILQARLQCPLMSPFNFWALHCHYCYPNTITVINHNCILCADEWNR